MKKLFFFLFTVTVLFTFTVMADTNWDLIEKYGDPKNYPDQDRIILYSNTDVSFETDGSFVTTTHDLYKILSPRGLQTLGVQDIGYNKRYMQVEILAANVYHADKSIESAPESNIKDQSISELQQLNIFEDNFRKKIITFSNLSIGDTIEIHYKIKSLALVKDNYCYMFGLQPFSPVKNIRVTIDGPKEKPLHFIVKNGNMSFKKEEMGARIKYSWEASDIKPLKREPAMASLADVGAKLIISTFNNWEELSRIGAALNKGKIDSSPEIIQKVNELTAGISDQKEKIKRIYNYISREIRYMGSSMDMGAFLEPHPASYTFEKKYGICRDKSVLFMAMLKEIGVKSEDALVNVSYQVEPEIPIIFFEHAINAVYLIDGSRIYMDTTMELSSAFGEPYVGGKYILRLTDEGEPLELIPKGKPSESLGRIIVTSALDNNSTLKLKAEITSTGIYDLQMRTIGKQLPGFSMGLFWQQIQQKVDPTAKIIKCDSTNAMDLATPYKITLDAEIPNYVSRLGDVYMMKLPMGKFQLDMLMGLVANQISGISERTNPIYLFTPMQSETETEIKIPEEYEITAYPDSFTFSQKPFFLETKITETGKNTLKFNTTFYWENDYISPEEYQIFRALMKKADKFSRSMIILKKGGKQ